MNNKISDSELEVMRILWRENRPLSFTEIRKELENTKKWSKSTIQTLVVRLRDKNAISTHNHYVTLYTANTTEDEYLSAEEQTFLNKLFGGSAKKFAAALCHSGKLDEKDIDELKQIFAQEGNNDV